MHNNNPNNPNKKNKFLLLMRVKNKFIKNIWNLMIHILEENIG